MISSRIKESIGYENRIHRYSLALRNEIHITMEYIIYNWNILSATKQRMLHIFFSFQFFFFSYI